MKKTEVKMNKTVYLGQKILGLIKTLMYEIHYGYYGHVLCMRYRKKIFAETLQEIQADN